MNITQWLKNLDLDRYASAFINNRIDEEALLTLTHDELKNDLGIIPLGDRKKILNAVESLKTPLHYSQAAASHVRDFCRQLAQTADWPLAVFDTWPGPMAHEACRLRELLRDGMLIGAIWQLKDLAEVLIKFPGVVMACDLLAHADDETLKNEIRGCLFTENLSMGAWRWIVCDFLSKVVHHQTDKSRLMLPELAGLFRPSVKKTTPGYRLLSDLCQWRNEQLGHGAFRLEIKEFQNELEAHVNALNALLNTQVQDGFWHGAELRISGPGREAIQGWKSIRKRHETQIPGPHFTRDLELALHFKGRVLNLSPYLAVKRCAVCRKNDVFFFDTVRKGTKFYFLDYLAGHKMGRALHQEPVLAGQVGQAGPVRPPEMDADAAMGKVNDRTVDKFLNETSLAAFYISPEYLRRRLETFINKHDCGIFWLCAPAHCGKSVFVNGLVPGAGLEKKPLAGDLKTAAFHIKREYRFYPAQFKEILKDAVKSADCLNITAGYEELPDLDLENRDRAAAFAQWMRALLALRPHTRLLICIDGLDELVLTDKGSVLDFIPAPHRMPERLYILLTSRPRPGCPPRVWDTVADRLNRDAGEPPLSEKWEFTPENREYRALLEQFFDRELKDHLRALIQERLQAVVKARKTDDIRIRIDIPATARKRYTIDGESVLAEAGIAPSDQKGAASLWNEAVCPALETYQAAFETVLKNARSRFLFVSHQTRLLKKHTIRLADLTRLPSGPQLFTRYLDELREVFTPRDWDYARRLLLILAAAEEAAAEDVRILESGAAEFEWRGLPLRVLADLMGESQRQSVRLFFMLYSLKEVIDTYKAEHAPDARYRLGLKDFTQTVRKAWRDELVNTHLKLARDFYESWRERFDEVRESQHGEFYCLRYLLAHTELSKDSAMREQVWDDKGLAVAISDEQGMRSYELANYRVSVQWYTYALRIFQRQYEATHEIAVQNDLAAAYTNRGNALEGQGKLSEAVKDYDAAIKLREDLKTWHRNQDRQYPPSWQNDLSASYINRGLALRIQGELSQAVKDHGYAIELREELKARHRDAERPFPHSWKNDLAVAYVNRGIVLGDQGELSGTVKDCSIAIKLLEELKAWHLDQDMAFPPSQQNSLAAAYMNRGNALEGQGKLSEAVKDHGCAVKLMEELEVWYLEQDMAFPPSQKNGLAQSYICRGCSLKNQGDLDSAVKDCGIAIKLMDALKSWHYKQEMAFPPEWQNNLAVAHMHRGNALQGQGELVGAVKDYDAAIKHREELKAWHLDQDMVFPPSQQNSLAAAYMNRGAVLDIQGELAGAIKDLGIAIKLMEELKAWHNDQNMVFPPSQQQDLAGAYMNIGVAFFRQGELAGAVKHYGIAIKLMEELIFVRQFAPAIPDLTIVYYNVILLIRRNDLPPAVRPEEWQIRAETFLNNLAQITNLRGLPGHWRKQTENLRSLLEKQQKKKRWNRGNSWLKSVWKIWRS